MAPEARASADWIHWERAVQKELALLEDNSLQNPVGISSDTTTSPYDWVFRVKRDAAGCIQCYKARAVFNKVAQIVNDIAENGLEVPPGEASCCLSTNSSGDGGREQDEITDRNFAYRPDAETPISNAVPKFNSPRTALYGISTHQRLWDSFADDLQLMSA